MIEDTQSINPPVRPSVRAIVEIVENKCTPPAFGSECW